MIMKEIHGVMMMFRRGNKGPDTALKAQKKPSRKGEGLKELSCSLR